MPEPARIGVTGASGQLGGLVAQRLSAAGISQALVVRDSARAPLLPGASVRVADFGDAGAVRDALAGLDTVLMVSLPAAEDRLSPHSIFIDSAREAGVHYLVYVSFFGAGPSATFTHARLHWATEERIRSSGVGFTFLRDNLYADLLVSSVGDDSAIRGPGARGRVSAVARSDVADVAAAVLQQPARHVGHTYDLTGPQALTLAEIADTISSATGRSVSYVPESLEDAYASRARYNAPQWQVDGWVSSYLAIAAGEMAAVSDAIPAILGRPARTLLELIQGQ